ncbi:MAG: hypothetical protein PHQ59_05285 [Candidatus Daviesbacteria bacterium]|nr:hypothetical protein [Candidatus Daviesbacteria bacterium]
MAIIEQRAVSKVTFIEQSLQPVTDTSKITDLIVIKRGETPFDLVLLMSFNRNAPFCLPPSDSDESFRATFNLMEERDVTMYSPRDQRLFQIDTPIFQHTYLGTGKYTELLASRKARKRALIEKIARNINSIRALKESTPVR